MFTDSALLHYTDQVVGVNPNPSIDLLGPLKSIFIVTELGLILWAETLAVSSITHTVTTYYLVDWMGMQRSLTDGHAPETSMFHHISHLYVVLSHHFLFFCFR